MTTRGHRGRRETPRECLRSRRRIIGPGGRQHGCGEGGGTLPSVGRCGRWRCPSLSRPGCGHAVYMRAWRPSPCAVLRLWGAAAGGPSGPTVPGRTDRVRLQPLVHRPVRAAGARTCRTPVSSWQGLRKVAPLAFIARLGTFFTAPPEPAGRARADIPAGGTHAAPDRQVGHPARQQAAAEHVAYRQVFDTDPADRAGNPTSPRRSAPAGPPGRPATCAKPRPARGTRRGRPGRRLDRPPQTSLPPDPGGETVEVLAGSFRIRLLLRIDRNPLAPAANTGRSTDAVALLPTALRHAPVPGEPLRLAPAARVRAC